MPSDNPTDELVDGLETVAETETAYCRLCDEPVISDADDWGEVLEALAEHGEQEHEWNGPREGWSENKENSDQ